MHFEQLAAAVAPNEVEKVPVPQGVQLAEAGAPEPV